MKTKDHKKLQKVKKNFEKKFETIVVEMAVRGTLIMLIGIFWDRIAYKFQIHYNPGLDWQQVLIIAFGALTIWRAWRLR